MELMLKQMRDIAASIVHMERSYDMRRRLNPHHPEEHKAFEKKQLERIQYENFSALKNLYVQHKEALLKYEGLTKDDLAMFRSLDNCVTQDLEKEFGL